MGGTPSEQERIILVFLTKGVADKGIALHSFISEQTIKALITIDFYGLGLNSATHAGAVAMGASLPTLES